jgi:hypothetical protein
MSAAINMTVDTPSFNQSTFYATIESSPIGKWYKYLIAEKSAINWKGNNQWSVTMSAFYISADGKIDYENPVMVKFTNDSDWSICRKFKRGRFC